MMTFRREIEADLDYRVMFPTNDTSNQKKHEQTCKKNRAKRKNRRKKK